MNQAYKHLQDKLKIMEMTIPQWVLVLTAVMAAGVFGLYLSPFGTFITIFLCVYVAGVPVGIVYVMGQSDYNLIQLARYWWDWRRSDCRYIAGSGDSANGFVVEANAEEVRRRERETTPTLDLEALWDS